VSHRHVAPASTPLLPGPFGPPSSLRPSCSLCPVRPCRPKLPCPLFCLMLSRQYVDADSAHVVPPSLLRPACSAQLAPPSLLRPACSAHLARAWPVAHSLCPARSCRRATVLLPQLTRVPPPPKLLLCRMLVVVAHPPSHRSLSAVMRPRAPPACRRAVPCSELVVSSLPICRASHLWHVRGRHAGGGSGGGSCARWQAAAAPQPTALAQCREGPPPGAPP